MVEWPAFGSGPDNTKYSALDQIDRSNFQDLRIAWEWESPSTAVAEANRAVKPGQFKPVPIMLDGVVYVATAVAQAAAIDAAIGETPSDPNCQGSGTGCAGALLDFTACRERVLEAGEETCPVQ